MTAVTRSDNAKLLAKIITLTIAIPTFNRSGYLDINLTHLCPQLKELQEGDVELLISDNGSPDETQEVIRRHSENGCRIRYVRNATNVGSDRNIAQCFQMAAGRYVLLLGDDDLLLDGALQKIVRVLKGGEYGVCYLGVYGYEEDFRRDKPAQYDGRTVIVRRRDKFVRRLGIYSTFISANVISKTLLHDVNAEQFVGTSLVQTHLVYEAIARSASNVCMTEYLVACRRNTNIGYNFYDIFVGQLDDIFKAYTGSCVPRAVFDSVRNDVLMGHVLYRILVARIANRTEDVRKEVVGKLRVKFGSNWRFKVCIMPALTLPRPLAVAWAGVWIVFTRAKGREMGRVFAFVRRLLSRRAADPVT